MAHAAVNAALAAAQGNSALVGAAGAATGEMAAMVALNVYGKPVRELSETEKQTVSALATLAAGLAGGLTGDSTADAVAGAQTGKTVVENNALGDKDAKKLGLRPVKILEVNPLKIGFVDEDGNVNAYGGKVVKPPTVNGKVIKSENGFYSVDGMKISQSYYDRLWGQGRPAPFLQAKEILNNNPKVIPDPRGAPGYFKYESSGLEMIYNPTTGQIGHIQPIKQK